MGIERWFICGIAVISLAGCAGQEAMQEDADAGRTDSVESAADDADQDESARTYGVDEGTDTQVDPLEDPDSPLSERIIYFDFDQSEIKSRFVAMIGAHASYLVEHPDMQVRLEGHTDERGSREYNIGLGERRAEAVRRMLMFQGVSSGQIETVSYGEEQPAAQGHDESAWSQNRRVEIVYER